MLLDRPIPGDEDFMIAIAVNLTLPASVSDANRRYLQYEASGDTNNSLQIFRNMPDGSTAARIMAGGTAQFPPGTLGLVGTGRAVISLRRTSGSFYLGSIGTDGKMTFGTARAAPMPTGLSQIYVGGAGNSAANVPVEFIGMRRGIFTNDQVAQFMRALAA
jgi:hypothetical protein